MSLYLTSTDPAVIAAIEHNADGRKELRSRALEWANERGFDTVMMNSFLGQTFVTGLPDQPEGFGQWTKPKRGRSHPFNNNVAERKAMRDLVFTPEPVPGLPESLTSVSDDDGCRFLMWPTPFISEGAAWVAYTHELEKGEAEKIGPQWAECLASRFYAAKEATE